MDILEPTVTAPEFVADEYDSAVKRLGGVSLSQVVDFYIKRRPAHVEPVMDGVVGSKRSEGKMLIDESPRGCKSTRKCLASDADDASSL